MNEMNPLLLTDVYNLSHQYMKTNTDWEASHIVNRKAPMILFGFDATARYILDIKITPRHIVEASNAAAKMNMKFPSELFEDLIVKADGLVKKVLKVEALPEGTWVPRGTPFAQVSNILEGFGELVTYWEGVFLHAWFPSACATRALEMKQYLEKRKERLTRFHSFGFRGHRSIEDALWASKAWSLFLPGTDDFNVMQCEHVIASSIPAVAHKVVMNYDDEWECYRHVLTESKRLGYSAVSIVIDTTSSDFFIDKYLTKVQQLADLLDIRPIYRPDSGDVLGQARKIVDILGIFGAGSNYGIIIGDSVTFDQAKQNDAIWNSWGYPTNFLTWGIGAGYYNDLTRDTLGWSMKTAFSNGKDRMKKTDIAFKRSIPGKVCVNYNKDGDLVCYTQNEDKICWYVTVGSCQDYYFTVRERANSQKTKQQFIQFSDELNKKMTDSTS